MKKPDLNERRALKQIFFAPMLIGVLILFGLFSALLGQGGIWFYLSWTALAVPIAIAARFALWHGRR